MAKKVCLIFPPFAAFSCIPSGICSLKSFVETRLEGTKITTLDWNNFFYNKLSDGSITSMASLCHLCKSNENKCTKILVDKASFFYKSLHFADVAEKLIRIDKLFYSDFNVYMRMILEFDKFLVSVKDCLESNIKDFFSSAEKSKDYEKVFKEIFKSEIENVKKNKYDLIGFSVLCKEQLIVALLLAKLIKSITARPIVFGGACISCLDSKEILESFDFIDFVICNEGENGFLELIKNLDNKRKDNIPNLIYKTGGVIIKNPEKPVENLDTLPPVDFSDLDISKYFTPMPVLCINFSRGCYWRKCTFCALNKCFGSCYRKKSTRHFINELKHYYHFGFRHFVLKDNVISADDMVEIADLLIKEKLDISFGFLSRPTKDFSKLALEKIFAAGCRFIFWGVESGSQRILDLMNKGTNIKDISELLKKSHKIGIANLVSYVKSFPAQTKKDILMNRKFLIEHNKYISGYSTPIFGLERDSVIALHPKKFRIKNIKSKTVIGLAGKHKVSDSCLDFDYKNDFAKNDLEPIKHLLKSYPSEGKKYFEHFLLRVTNKDINLYCKRVK